MKGKYILILAAVLFVVGAQVWVFRRCAKRSCTVQEPAVAESAKDAQGLSSNAAPLVAVATNAIAVIPQRETAQAVQRLHVLTETELAPVRAAFASQRIVEIPDVPRGRQILLCRRRVVAPEGRSIPTAASGVQSASARGTMPFLLQFSVPLSAKLRARLENAGAELRGYFPNNALLAELTPAALAAVGEIAEVSFATEYLPQDKLQPFLAELAETQKDVAAPVSVRVGVQFFTAQDLAAAMPVIEKMGGCILGQSKPDAKEQSIRAELPLSGLEVFARRGGVYWIEEISGVKPLAPAAQK